MRRPPGNGEAASEGPGDWGLWGAQESRRLCCAGPDRCGQALLRIGINMMALPGGRQLDSIPLPGQRLHLLQADSVQRWMEDLKLMTEC
uniref:INSC spindle orientation adaptor protein n=1 Tax=Chinchilla lanigera TaxID=34839 RepID=A0A8C2WBJ0_CHILA